MTKLELNILGCGSATPTLRHQPSCQVLNVRDKLMMIDCGEGAQLMMRRMKLHFSRLGNIFISHLHGDHCLGLPGLLSTLALQGKTGTVTVHIFEKGADLFSNVMKYFCRDTPYKIEFHVIPSQPGVVIYEDDAITVTTVPLVHRVPAVGFLFAEKPKRRHINAAMTQFHHVPLYAYNNLQQGLDYIASDGTVIPNDVLTTPADKAVSYAYCSDTRFSHEVAKAVHGVDWLYHEATYGDEYQDKARERYHSTARQAATIAKEAGVGQLIIGHFSKRYLNEDELLKQAREVFPRTILANEGLCLDLNRPLP